MVSESHDAEEDGEDDETHELNGLATDRVHKGDSDPVARNGTSADQNDVSNSNVIEEIVGILLSRITNGLKDCGVVEAHTVEGDIEEEPGTCRSKKDFAVLPLTDVRKEVGPRCLGGLELRSSLAHGGHAGHFIRNTFSSARKVGLDVRTTLDDIARDVKSVSRSLRDGQTEVESNAAWHCTHSNDDTPHLVDSNVADSIASGLGTDARGSHCALQRALEAHSDDEGDNTGSELTETLVGEHSTHHRASPLGRSEFGCDDGGQWVVTTNSDTHEYAPEDEDPNDVDGRRLCGECLGESGENDDDQFQSIHLLSSHNICEETKSELTNNSTSRCGDLDRCVTR